MADVGSNSRETELVLAPNEHAFVLDRTKGNVNVISGPHKTSLSTSDSPVIFDVATKKFTPVTMDRSIRQNITAPKGWYVILKNPSRDNKQPTTGSNQSLGSDTLVIGQKVNLSGPMSFSLWPGQIAKIVRGHTLCSNQYLVARVYDEDAAKANWSSAIIKNAVPQSQEKTASGESDTAPVIGQPPVPVEHARTEFNPNTLVTGQILIIQGTDVSFYIPPTGIEVEADANGSYVRDAVTLERLEYCILKDENGNKRYMKGPNVVFPSPTEQFIDSANDRKFRAIELNEQSGLYIKVIEDYTDGDETHEAGDELFITGRTQSIYFPCSQHSIIKYGDQEKHFAVAIPVGEARYVLNRDTGNVQTLKGPAMFLPDPRKEVIVRRILEDKECALLYPGNVEALAYNQKLRANRIGFTNYVEDSRLKESGVYASDVSQLDALYASNNLSARGMIGAMSQEEGSRSFKAAMATNSMNRGTNYTPPRTLTLDNKYEGAVTVNVYTGFAIQLVNKSGKRRVVTGPCTVLLEYDEYLEEMKLSTGRPKNADKTISTAYLRVLNNRVSDLIRVVTEDLIDVTIDLKYLIKFEGDSDVWFNIDNYVQYMSHHMRSVVTNAVRKLKAAHFHLHGIDIIRDLILGGKADGSSARTGRTFKENGMVIYEVEVLAIDIVDETIRNLLVRSRQDALKGDINVASRALEVERVQQLEASARLILAATSETNAAQLSAAAHQEKMERDFEDARLASDATRRREAETLLSDLAEVIREREQAQADQDNLLRLEDLTVAERKTTDYLKRVSEEAAAYVTKGGVVTPQLVSALTSLAQGNYLNNLRELAPLSIVQGLGLEETMQKLFKGTPLESMGSNLASLGMISAGQVVSSTDRAA